MKAKEFIRLINTFNPSAKEHSKVFKELTQKFPYFQLPHLYYAKTLQVENADALETALSECAVRTFDRGLLHQWMKKSFHKKESLQTKTTSKNNTADSSTVKKTTPTKQKELAKKESSLKVVEKVVKDSSAPSTQPTSSSKELLFSDWIRSIKEEDIRPTRTEVKSKRTQIIDSFLASNQKIEPQKTIGNNVDLSKEHLAADSELMTETLAKVLLQQKKYGKAIKAYTILGLKYPEKNSFFANQIKEIERLQNLKK